MSPVDLHLHSTASDGTVPPAEVVRHAATAGLSLIALTDHDTLAGVAAAQRAGVEHGVRVVGGCEFSVAAPWGEMHLLGYALVPDDPALEGFLAEQRAQRGERMREIVTRLVRAGIRLTIDEVEEVAAGAPLGRPHAARALIRRGAVRSVTDAFDRFLSPGRPGFVPKQLPTIQQVTALVRGLGGVTSAAHLKDRGTAPVIRRLAEAGLDGVEVLHPAHDAEAQERLATLAEAHGLLTTGGTDWHGDDPGESHRRAPLGSIAVPAAWWHAVEALHTRRREALRRA